VVDADLAISETGEQGVAISRPGKRYAIGGGSVGSLGDLALNLGLELGDHLLGLEVPDLDGLLGSSDQPVPVGGEDHGVDDIISVQRVQVLALRQIPKHGNAILSTRGAQRAIGRDGDGVEVASVLLEGVLKQLGLVLEVPYLDLLVPAARNELGTGGGESNARHPLVVGGSIGSLGHVVLHLAEGVPKLDVLVTATRDDLTVVSRQGNSQNILGVSSESANAVALVDVPEAESSVPRGRDGALSIGGEDDVRHEVVVATEGSLGIAVVALLALNVPDNDGLVTGARDNNLRVLSRGSDGGNPTSVTLEGAD